MSSIDIPLTCAHEEAIPLVGSNPRAFQTESKPELLHQQFSEIASALKQVFSAATKAHKKLLRESKLSRVLNINPLYHLWINKSTNVKRSCDCSLYSLQLKRSGDMDSLNRQDMLVEPQQMALHKLQQGT